MPTWYETLRSLNHDACCSNCRPCEKSKRASASIQKPTSTSATSAPNDGDGAAAEREDEAGEPSRDGQEDQDRDDPGIHVSAP